MNGRLRVLVATAVATAIGAGCAKCRHTAYHDALYPTAEPACPPPIRNQVFLFMMNGHDVLEFGGMLGLRDQLCQAGYPMVSYAQRMDREWYHREMWRVARDNPGARILLLGYGSAAPVVTGLAYEAARDELPIDAVIYLDPVGSSGDLAGTLPYHSVAVRSHNWRGGRGLGTSDTIEMTNVGHYALPNHPATVDALVQLMSDSAGRVNLPPANGLPRLPLRDKLDPTPRGVDPATVAQPLDDWDYLKPGPPFPTLPGTPLPAPSARLFWWCEKI
ncbi:MAG TPA: hypothetical protein VM597_28585 [Gemmataceae bacterium]|nr:hypothetical protein [Gemmataceae bacterium]